MKLGSFLDSEGSFQAKGLAAMHCRLLAASWVFLGCFLHALSLAAGTDLNRSDQRALPLLSAALASKRDLWGEAAMRQTNGASYEFFENLLPPPRYVNTDFHFYPIVLSAPNSRVKARLISDGSGINLSGGARGWNDAGSAFIFRVGQDGFKF